MPDVHARPAVLGVDACPGGWVGIRLAPGSHAARQSEAEGFFAPTLDELAEAVGPVAVVGIDIPLGLPDDSKGVSSQAFALAVKLLEADAWHRTPRLASSRCTRKSRSRPSPAASSSRSGAGRGHRRGAPGPARDLLRRVAVRGLGLTRRPLRPDRQSGAPAAQWVSCCSSLLLSWRSVRPWLSDGWQARDHRSPRPAPSPPRLSLSRRWRWPARPAGSSGAAVRRSSPFTRIRHRCW